MQFYIIILEIRVIINYIKNITLYQEKFFNKYFSIRFFSPKNRKDIQPALLQNALNKSKL